MHRQSIDGPASDRSSFSDARRYISRSITSEVKEEMTREIQTIRRNMDDDMTLRRKHKEWGNNCYLVCNWHTTIIRGPVNHCRNAQSL